MNQIDLAQYVSGRSDKEQKYGRDIYILCPFHVGDTKPSMRVSEDFAYCYSCGKYATIKDFAMLYNDTISADKIAPAARKKKKEYNVKIRPSSIEAVSRHLLSNDDLVSYWRSRGVTTDSLRKWEIGYAIPPVSGCELPRFVIPSKDRDGKYNSIIYRENPALFKENDKKYVIHPGCPATLFNESATRKDQFVYVGGQVDAITAEQFGIPAVGACGEGTFKREWVSLFVGKKHSSFLTTTVQEWPQPRWWQSKLVLLRYTGPMMYQKKKM